jgi:hypothetical protein
MEGYAHDEHVTGSYYLVAFDDAARICLTFGNEKDHGVVVVRETVFAVGYDDNFIIVAEHPHNEDGPGSEMDRSETNYYVVALKEPPGKRHKDNLYGPMATGEFEIVRLAMGVPEDLQFTRMFKELE